MICLQYKSRELLSFKVGHCKMANDARLLNSLGTPQSCLLLLLDCKEQLCLSSIASPQHAQSLFPSSPNSEVLSGTCYLSPLLPLFSQLDVMVAASPMNSAFALFVCLLPDLFVLRHCLYTLLENSFNNYLRSLRSLVRERHREQNAFIHI